MEASFSLPALLMARALAWPVEKLTRLVFLAVVLLLLAPPAFAAAAWIEARRALARRLGSGRPTVWSLGARDRLADRFDSVSDAVERGLDATLLWLASLPPVSWIVAWERGLCAAVASRPEMASESAWASWLGLNPYLMAALAARWGMVGEDGGDAKTADGWPLPGEGELARRSLDRIGLYGAICLGRRASLAPIDEIEEMAGAGVGSLHAHLGAWAAAARSQGEARQIQAELGPASPASCEEPGPVRRL